MMGKKKKGICSIHDLGVYSQGGRKGEVEKRRWLGIQRVIQY